MQIVRWKPIKDMFGMRNPMNLFDELFYSTDTSDAEMSVWNRKPVVDIYDNDDNIVIKAELPGIDKKDITVNVKDRLLTLKGRRSLEKEVKEGKYHRRERAFGSFARVFTLPAEVDPDKIQADYKDGVLTIDIPKPDEHKPKKITVH